MAYEEVEWKGRATAYTEGGNGGGFLLSSKPLKDGMPSGLAETPQKSQSGFILWLPVSKLVQFKADIQLFQRHSKSKPQWL